MSLVAPSVPPSVPSLLTFALSFRTYWHRWISSTQKSIRSWVQVAGLFLMVRTIESTAGRALLRRLGASGRSGILEPSHRAFLGRTFKSETSANEEAARYRTMGVTNMVLKSISD